MGKGRDLRKRRFAYPSYNGERHIFENIANSVNVHSFGDIAKTDDYMNTLMDVNNIVVTFRDIYTETPAYLGFETPYERVNAERYKVPLLKDNNRAFELFLNNFINNNVEAIFSDEVVNLLYSMYNEKCKVNRCSELALHSDGGTTLEEIKAKFKAGKHLTSPEFNALLGKNHKNDKEWYTLVGDTTMALNYLLEVVLETIKTSIKCIALETGVFKVSHTEKLTELGVEYIKRFIGECYSKMWISLKKYVFNLEGFTSKLDFYKAFSKLLEKEIFVNAEDMTYLTKLKQLIYGDNIIQFPKTNAIMSDKNPEFLKFMKRLGNDFIYRQYGKTRIKNQYYKQYYMYVLNYALQCGCGDFLEERIKGLEDFYMKDFKIYNNVRVLKGIEDECEYSDCLKHNSKSNFNLELYMEKPKYDGDYTWGIDKAKATLLELESNNEFIQALKNASK